MKVTLKDIARECAVSVGAVSDILKEKGNFKEETRSRVMAAVRRLNYRGAGAVAEAAANLRTIGLVVPGIDVQEDAFFSRGIAGVKAAAVNNGYNVSLYTEDEIIAIIEDKPTPAPVILPGGGLIIMAPFKDWEMYLPRLRSRGVAVAMAFRDTGVAGVAVVNQDLRQGILLGLEHLFSLGHTRIGFIRIVPRADHGTSLRAYREFVKAHELGTDDAFVADVHRHTRETFDAWVTNLMERDSRPTAFMCEADHLAMGMVRIMTRKGYRVPEDVAVVGYGDTPAAAQYMPAITSVHNPAKEVAGLAMDLLAAGTDKRPEKNYNISDSTVRYTLQCTLAVRESCGSTGGERNKGGIV